MLQRALAAAGVAIAALGAAHFLTNRTPTALTIGQVEITETGITVSDPTTQASVRIDARDVLVHTAERGTSVVMAGELLVEGDAHRNFLHLTAWDAGGGFSSLMVGTRPAGERGYEAPTSAFHAQSRGTDATATVSSPEGPQLGWRSEPPRD